MKTTYAENLARRHSILGIFGLIEFQYGPSKRSKSVWKMTTTPLINFDPNVARVLETQNWMTKMLLSHAFVGIVAEVAVPKVTRCTGANIRTLCVLAGCT